MVKFPPTAIVCAALLLGLASGVTVCPITGGLSGKCQAHASISVTATSGSCFGEAGASCKVWTQSQTVYNETIAEWLRKPTDDLCKGSTITAVATGVAKAIAQVWASTYVNIQCTGGYACGFTLANGEGLAIALVDTVALVVADAAEAGAIDGQLAESFCYADIRAVGGSLASAAAEAQIEVCKSNGDVNKMESSFASAIQTTVAKAFAAATVKICKDTTSSGTTTSGDLVASTVCSGSGEVIRDGPKPLAFGDACATTNKVNLCRGTAGDHCCKGGKTFCTFTSQQKKTCAECSLFWRRVSNDNGVLVYRKGDGTNCVCDPIL